MSCLRVRSRLYAKAAKMGLCGTEVRDGYHDTPYSGARERRVHPVVVPSSYLSRFAGISMGGRRPSNFLS